MLQLLRHKISPSIALLIVIIILWFVNLFVTGCLWSILDGYLSEVNAPRLFLVWCGICTALTLSGYAFIPIIIVIYTERSDKRE